MSGVAQCTMVNDLAPDTIRMTFEGPMPVKGIYTGTVEVQYPILPAPQVEPWSARELGAGALEGTTSGSWSAGSAGLNWDARFDLTLE
ncbi:MAG TPA: hypothetical protein ENK18_05005 [Deltaproteobacteria bacterium]|nr:hypothetical protein [Deltaproteobacteria bacterium]